MHLRKLVDTGQDIDSTVGLRYIWINMRIIGLLPPARYRKLYIVYSWLMNLLFSVGIQISVIISLLRSESREQFFAKIWLGLATGVSPIKAVATFLRFDLLKRCRKYLRRLDARCQDNWNERRHILDAIRICHMYYTFHVAFYILLGLGVDIVALRKQELQVSKWTPQFFEDPNTNFIIGFCYQALVHLFLALQSVTNDTYPPCYLIMIIAHIRALATRIERIGYDPEMSAEDNRAEIINCIHDHQTILKLFNCVRQVISSVILVPFFVTATAVALTYISFRFIQRDPVHTVLTATFFFSFLLHPLPCCYLADLVLQESEYITTAIYNCNWYEQNASFRKIINIFMSNTQKLKEIRAGNIIPVSLETFHNVVKFSVSMYTLLSQLKF